MRRRRGHHFGGRFGVGGRPGLAFGRGNPTHLSAFGAEGSPAQSDLCTGCFRIDDITHERNRRLAAGFSYDFDDVRGVHTFATTENDMRGWDEVTKGAQAALALSAPNSPIDLVTETGPVTVTALEWQQILVAATAHRQPIWQSSFLLQAMSPIPSDYADDSYWP
ncbi:hypothetical protein IWQ55_001363 [Labrenzia sp. EL_208]|nr:hypothetical protein [Labrenzia sp. EL_132]MBG6228165.1 hypothetical protein [Labrenzia sp. EL_208]